MEGKFIEVTRAGYQSQKGGSIGPGVRVLVNVASIASIQAITAIGYPKAQTYLTYVDGDDYENCEESYDEIKAALDVAGCTIVLLASDRMAAKEASPDGR